MGRQGPGDAHALLLPAGELVGIAAGEGRVQAHGGQELRHLPLALLPAPAAGEGGDIGDVFRHGHVGKQAHALDGVADAPAQGDEVALRHVLPVDINGALVGRQQAVDQAQGRGLAAAAAADHGQEFAAVYRQAEILQDRVRAVAFCDMVKSDTFFHEAVVPFRKRKLRVQNALLHQEIVGDVRLVLAFHFHQIVQAGHILVGQQAVHQHQGVFQAGVLLQRVLADDGGAE